MNAQYLHGKKIILGVTGSIAAYKTAILTRLLIKNNASVKIIMTPFAKEFITPVTLATLSKNTVLCDFFKHDDGKWNNHIELGIWADLMLIAPATANTIAKLANGICDNLLLTTSLSARCPVIIAPAMDCDMLAHPATIKNLETLKSFGNIIIEPSAGTLASGLEGKGRMEEPEKIISFINDFFNPHKKLNKKKIIVTAGPTYEAIDPVRFIGNYSSGKMGYAIAEELAFRGAEVTLISGPVQIKTQAKNIFCIPVTSAQEMYENCLKYFPESNGAVMAAAVADYTPTATSPQKIKSGKNNFSVKLTPTPDIASALGKIKKKSQLLAGFALETENIAKNPYNKLIKKNFDFIIINSPNDKGAGFLYDTNKISILDKNNNIENFKLKSKVEAAKDIVDKIYKWFEPQ
ncbi:MAG: bifunctional phosphopantothenoylcysteine decarboxylase/phosphopantothenate--cysteine ligase CoaBC [Bacteroidia bacterium]|nr:bifunctional phosphopantothenoylcysteine decarboxylase/phosphopantothenate--cysteine ligase CoaBC [Bacteroidia bacterium]